MAVLGAFYRWALADGYAVAEPLTYKQAMTAYADSRREVTVNQARRQAKNHVTIKYLADKVLALFPNALSGSTPNGEEDRRCRGGETRGASRWR